MMVLVMSSNNISKKSYKTIESVEKALVLLQCFTDSTPELSLKELSEKTGYYKSRVLQICDTLILHGFIIRTQKSVYKLGPKLMVLGKVYERSNSLISLAPPILRELSALTGEASKIFVIEGVKRTCLVRERGPSPLSYNVEEGESFELYAGAGGKVLLAYAPQEFRDRVFDERVVKRLTSTTIVGREKFEQECAEIRSKGYAVSMGELFADVAGMAAPIFNNSGEVFASLTIAGPIQRFTDERCQEMLTYLLSSASKLSTLLGSTHPSSHVAMALSA